jgi:xanthine dehydrogenase accessory factor
MKTCLFEQLLAARAGKRPLALVTHLGDGRQALVEAATAQGELALSPNVLDEIRREHLLPERSGITRTDDQLFVRVYAPTPRLLLVGAVNIAQALAPMAALSGLQVTVIDPRRAFASSERFPGVTLHGGWPDEAMAELAPDAQTAVVALSHDPKLDDPALTAALASAAFYVGALGSSRTHAQRLARLRAAGCSERLDRIHAPVGLDLGGRSPGEIAVAILAQIIQIRYGKDRR